MMKAGWKTVALGDVADIERDSVAASEIADGTTYVGLENIESGGRFLNVRAVAGGELASNKFAFTDRHVLYGKLRPYLAKIARPDFGGICSTDILPILPGPALSRGYLAHFLLQPSVVDFANSRSEGVNLPRLSPKTLARFDMPLPPLPDQRRIAAILDQAEALRAKRRAALGLLEGLAQAIFLEMFGDPLANPKGWAVHKFDHLCDRITVGIVVQPASHYVSAGVPAIRSLNIKPGKIVLEDLVYFSQADNDGKLRKTKLKAGDIVLVRTGQPGTAAVVPAELDGVNAIDVLIATPQKGRSDATYLCAFFNSAGGRGLVLATQRGQIQKHLNVGSLNAAAIPLPPHSLQQTFANRIGALEALKTTHRASLTQLDALFASLQHRAFRGEL